MLLKTAITGRKSKKVRGNVVESVSDGGWGGGGHQKNLRERGAGYTEKTLNKK